MPSDPLLPRLKKLVAPFRIENGGKFKLDKIDPEDTGSFKSKEEAEVLLKETVALLSEQQAKLYAYDKWAVLCIFQAMDAAGKDGAIKHVFSGVNPQGCQVYAFKPPNAEELDHDFLWRACCRLPERGRIGIFNRSYYEEVLVVRVHPELLNPQKLPGKLVGKSIWKERLNSIIGLEKHLAQNGTAITKFFLHLSKKEQKKRFMSRLDEPEKNWKFERSDVTERGHWNEYMKAYEETIRATAEPHAPWYVIPADHKWFTRAVAAAALVVTLSELETSYPEVTAEKRKELLEARRLLENE